eukprot:jgi/Chlat1/2669/Chrsp18S02988
MAASTAAAEVDELVRSVRRQLAASPAADDSNARLEVDGLLRRACADDWPASTVAGSSLLLFGRPTSRLARAAVEAALAAKEKNKKLAVAVSQQLSGLEGSETAPQPTFQDSVKFLRLKLRSNTSSGIVTAFVIEEFDLFPRRPQQEFLYNLFDVVSTSDVRVAIICLAQGSEVVQHLEKRVRSRFVHKSVVCYPDQKTPAQLLLESMRSKAEDSSVSTRYNTSLEVVLQRPEVVQLLQRVAGSTVDAEAAIKRLGLYALLAMDRRTGVLSTTNFDHAASKLSYCPERWHPLEGLSRLQLYVLAAALRLERRGRVPFSFEAVFVEYAHAGGDAGEAWPVALRAYEGLLDRRILAYTDKCRRAPRELRQARVFGMPSRLEKAINAHPLAIPLLKKWLMAQPQNVHH